LPDGWRWARLGNLVEKSSAKHQPDKESRLPFVGLEHIPPHEMRVEGVGSFADMRSAGSAFVPGDVLYGRLRPYLNKVWVADRAGACSGELLVLRPKAGMDARYIALNLHSQRYVYYASHIVTGDRPRIDFDLVGAFPVPVPDEATQRQVVARIDALFTEIGEGEAALAEARAGVETYRKALLKAAVTGELTADWRASNPSQETGEHLLQRILADRRARWQADPKNARKKYIEPTGPNADGLPELPDGWAWASVAYVVEAMTYGTSTKCDRNVNGVPVLRMGNIQDGMVDLSDLKFASECESLPMLQAGDVLFNRTNSAELLGKSAVYEGDPVTCSYASYLVGVRLAYGEPHFFAAWLNSIFGKAWVAENKSQQVGQANLSAGKLVQMPLPVAPMEEQRVIVQRLNEALSRANNQLADGPEIESLSSALRQSILAAAFCGELVA
jgi:type I restriction enzyme S subunit